MPPELLQQTSVRFELEDVDVCEVTPYAEVYGEHPRRFVFGRHSEMLSAVFGGFVGRKGNEDLDQGIDAVASVDAQESLSLHNLQAGLLRLAGWVR